MDMITGKGPSNRNEIYYFTEGTLSAVRVDDFKYRFTDQPGGWFGGTVKVDMPPASSIFCLPILPQRGCTVASSVVVATERTMLRGPLWDLRSCG